MGEPPRIRAIDDGPLVVADVPVVRMIRAGVDPDGSPRWTTEPIVDVGSTCALCRCDRSGTKPFCDRWPDRLPCGELPESDGPSPVFAWQPPEGVDGPMVALKPNGPIRVSGGVGIEREDGSLLDDGVRVSLCRCGHSDAMPFCDGTHKVVGFSEA
jgi:CDGSH-type Zn-finger protein